MTVFSLSVWTRSVVTFVCPPLTTILSPTSFPRFSSETHPSSLLNFVSLSFHSSLHSPSLSLILFYLVRLFLLSTLSPHLLFSPSILCFLCFLHRSTPSVLYLFILFSPSLSLFSIVSVTLLRLLHLFFLLNFPPPPPPLFSLSPLFIFCIDSYLILLFPCRLSLPLAPI